MEQIEAALKGWPQAPYTSKHEVDANYIRMMVFGCSAKHSKAVNLGIASHNLFDLSYAMLLRSEYNIEPYISFEMLEGMADHMRRVVQTLVNDMLLYCPVAKKDEFQNAVAYLVRRLDENTAPANFLRQMFDLTPGTSKWVHQAEQLKHSVKGCNQASKGPRRIQNREKPPVENKPFTFQNEPDTDWSLKQNRDWINAILNTWKDKKTVHIESIIASKTKFEPADKIKPVTTFADPSRPDKIIYKASLASKELIESSLKNTFNAPILPLDTRIVLLKAIAQELRVKRGDLIALMLVETAKTVYEADVEISEAIDFAEYYAFIIESWLHIPDVEWKPKGTVLVAPPWNFPCSIPCGGIFAGLATGNRVIFKPAPEAMLVGWELAHICWKAGVDKKHLQLIIGDDQEIGTLLVQDQRINCVILTGGTETAKHLLKLRPGLDLMAETGGKNALIISNLADRDLAIKDLVQSAFGHAGQKCSACSLAIVFAEVYDDPHFRKQLKDAAESLKVGSQWDLSTRINPLIRPANEKLLRGLTTLEEGEEWLLKPKQDPNIPNLWSPGIKLGVKLGTFTHQEELFGPVLGVMRADNLKHAIELANATPYGLTSGLHSLDHREQKYWMKHIQAGNCYINRTITGAIVQRQPFGGCKASSFGLGMKAGGPNYLTQFMIPKQVGIPPHIQISKELKKLYKFVVNSSLSKIEKIDWFEASGSYIYFWKHFFSKSNDPALLQGQDNLFSYHPHNKTILRFQETDRTIDLLKCISAALVCNARLICSGSGQFFKILSHKIHAKSIQWREETESEFIENLHHDKLCRIRLLSPCSNELLYALSMEGCSLLRTPVVNNGRIELLNYLREVSLSVDYHRYGNLGDREHEQRKPLPN